jgi:hypothetical protein
MADYQGNSPTDWERLGSTTLQEHVREEEPAWMRSFSMFALIESAGQILYNQSGRGFDWPVQYRRHNLSGNTGETSRNFVRRNLDKRAELPINRGYQAEDSFSEAERLMNRGENAVVNFIDNFVERLDRSVKQGIALEFFTDGNATGNTEKWHGIESFMGWTQTVTITSAGAVARSANDADIVAYPNDSYAGLSTVLGNYSGDGDSTLSWPRGYADPEFDFWSPLIFAYNSSATDYPAAGDTFATQGDEVLRAAIIECQRNAPMEDHPTTCLLDRALYRQFLNAIDGKEQIRVQRGEPLELTALGFKNVVEFDGVEVSWDTATPGNVGYVMNYKNIQLRCMYPTVFDAQGPIFDEHTNRYNAVVQSLGNLKFRSPRNFAKLVDSTP